MKVHVTGAAGLIGSHLVRRLLDLGHQVGASDDFSAGYVDNVDPRAEFYGLDCSNADAVAKALRGCEVVYHCAAFPHEGLSVFSPRLIVGSIVNSTMAVASACAENKIRRLVNFSSMARYGALEVPFREDMPPAPEDPYGLAKLMCEREVDLLARIHGFEAVHVVPHNVIGVGQKYDDAYRNVVAIMINLCLQGKPPIIYGDGEQRRCFSSIDDMLGLLVACATQDSVVGEVVNIGPDEEFVTINDLAGLVMELTGLDSRVGPVHVPARPQEVRFATCSADKARRLFGYETRTSLRDGVAAMVEWIRRRGPRPFRYHLPLEIVNDRTPKTWLERMF